MTTITEQKENVKETGFKKHAVLMLMSRMSRCDDAHQRVNYVYDILLLMHESKMVTADEVEQAFQMNDILAITERL